MRLAILGDIHVYQLRLAPWDLIGKRAWGQANLWLKRRHKFDANRLFPAVAERIASINPDRVLIAGDLTTTALPGEFRAVARLLEPVTARFPTVIVPGNHDRYTWTAALSGRIEHHLGRFMIAPSPGHRRLSERWHLIAIDSAVPRFCTARGRVGPGPLDRLERLLAQTPADHGVLVINHYPFLTPPFKHEIKWHHRLADADALRKVLASCKARVLYVHGHLHRAGPWRPPDADLARVTLLDAGAPCMTRPDHPHGQGFFQADLPDDPAQPVTLTHHRNDGAAWTMEATVW